MTDAKLDTQAFWEPFREYVLGHGTRIDGSIVAFWATKGKATRAALAIGFRASDVGRVHTRFQSGFAIIDGSLGVMRKTAYAALLASRATTKAAT